MSDLPQGCIYDHYNAADRLLNQKEAHMHTYTIDISITDKEEVTTLSGQVEADCKMTAVLKLLMHSDGAELRKHD